MLPATFVPPMYHKTVMHDEQEEELVCYLKNSAQRNHGLSPIQIRRLVYTFARAKNLKCPKSWAKNECAGPDWYTGFMKRHQRLSLRQPEATSQARAAGCNYVAVHGFQQEFQQIMAVKRFPAHRLFNGDETSTPTVLAPIKVVAERGVKQVSIFMLFEYFHSPFIVKVTVCFCL